MKDKLKTKIKLPDIDEDDFPYKFYKCWWSDIISCENWEDLSTIKKSKPAICITMGWLISTKNSNYIFSYYYFYPLLVKSDFHWNIICQANS